MPKSVSPKSAKSPLSARDKQLNKVVPVRLPEDKWESIRKEANDLGIGPSTLARIWILDTLRKVNGNNHNGNGHSLE
ncbi:MAG TPA: hypothetical protein VMB24_00540 [Dehalococcoidales bacterium]|nr:hypothetical protein [Dehalococcoidales bacterium]